MRIRRTNQRAPLAMLTAGVIAVGMSACGTSSGDSGSDDTLSVGVFFPGSVTDTGFMQSGYLGYERVEKSTATESTSATSNRSPPPTTSRHCSASPPRTTWSSRSAGRPTPTSARSHRSSPT